MTEPLRTGEEPEPVRKGGKRLEEILREAESRISDEEAAKIPPDASINLDHYLYGAPKKDQ